jgi:hypothetical protein
METHWGLGAKVAEKKLMPKRDEKNLTPSEVRKNVAATRESVRARIDGVHLVDGIMTTVKTLEAGEELVGERATPVPLDSTRVSALSVAMQARFKLLAKVLPDLKAVELSGPEGEPLEMRETSPTEVAARLLWLWRQSGTTVEGEVEPEQPRKELPDFLK